jgi:hypothetical protein
MLFQPARINNGPKKSTPKAEVETEARRRALVR